MTTDWHTDDFPPLRPTAPWLMEEMIDAQRLLAAASSELPGGTEAATIVGDAVAQGRSIEVIGCGSSEHAALAIAALIRAEHRSAKVTARQALDAAEEPTAGAVAIGVSHDGGTRATALALEAAADATTIAITGRADSAVAGAAQHIVVTPRLDESWCHTVAYTSAILAGAHVAGLDATALAAGAAAFADDALFQQARAIGRALPTNARIVTAGMGVDHIAARELALKIEEGARMPATAHHLETLLHGHLAGCDLDTTHVIVFACDPRGSARRAQRASIALRAISAIGIPATIVLPAASDVEVPTGVRAIRIPQADSAPLLSAITGAAFALQGLTLGLVDAIGWNPDLIRRESGPYRAAALIGDDGNW